MSGSFLFFPLVRRPFQKRWVLLLTVALWVTATVLPDATRLVSALLPASKTEVQSSAIEVGGAHRLATCAHHPQGCPAKCLCPKTGFVGDERPEASAGSSRHDRLTAGVSWVECSEVRTLEAPEYSVFLPEIPLGASVTTVMQLFAPEAPALPRGAVPAPPAKIPIG